MAYFSSKPSQLLSPPTARRKQTHSTPPGDDYDDFSDLELSFEKSVSLGSSQIEPKLSVPEVESPQPMDISPLPLTKPSVHNRPRAYTASARMFGQDVSNRSLNDRAPPSSQSGSKKLQRSALPTQWIIQEEDTRSLKTRSSSAHVSCLFFKDPDY
jgi:M-phase inducer tyrosine phosphatase